MNNDWRVYGIAWFTHTDKEAKSEIDAKMNVLNKLMDVGIIIDIKELEAEPIDGEGDLVSV